MERIIEQKTSEAIKKLEKQFKSTFMAYTSTNDKREKHKAHKKLEGKTKGTFIIHVEFNQFGIWRTIVTFYNIVQHILYEF